MKICTIGLGYIGLPTSVTFAKYGANVVGVDVNEAVVEKLNRGEIHIEEPGIAEIVKEIVANNTFKASTKPEKADVFIVAVPTPNNNDTHRSCDLTYVLDAVKSLIPFLEKGNTVIIESTIAPRSMDDYVKPLIEAAGFVVGQDVYLVHCPERVLPGQILHELIYNNRIVGGITPACSEAGANIYSLFVKGEIVKTDAKTAEMSKLMENTFRDVNIALANELAKICNKLDINVLDVIQMANKHPRVNIHTPGPGVGGHCLAVDPYFIVAKTPEEANIIKLSRDTNNSMPHYVVENVKKLIGEKGNVAVFGITYKANVDDMRESPAMEIVDLLKDKEYNVTLHDPHVESDTVVLVNEFDAVKNADLILILTDHQEFKTYDFNALTALMNKPVIFDTRNCINPESNTIQYVNYGNLFQHTKTYNYAK